MMKRPPTQRVEFHIIQTHPVSNMNSDASHSPKELTFGDTHRARISSQSSKAAIRSYGSENELVPAGDKSFRTKHLARKIAERMEAQHGIAFPEGAAIMSKALAHFGSNQEPGAEVDDERPAPQETKGKKGKKGKPENKPADAAAELDGKTPVTLFVSEKEINEIAAYVAKERPSGEMTQEFLKRIEEEFGRILSAQDHLSTDVALFGRMLATLPEAQVDATCQMAHSFSTHAVNRQYDWFVTIDDVARHEKPGANMMGSVEFNAATYYRYAVVNVHELRERLRYDEDAVTQAVATFTEAMILATPTGKKNSMATCTAPAFVLVTVREGQAARYLGDGFDATVESRGAGFTNASIERLIKKWQTSDRKYFKANAAFVLDVTEPAVNIKHSAQTVENLEELITRILATIRK